MLRVRRGGLSQLGLEFALPLVPLARHLILNRRVALVVHAIQLETQAIGGQSLVLRLLLLESASDVLLFAKL
jgi:hypothetical protein